MRYAMLIDNEYCIGCHSCEISCKNEKELPLGQWGIKITEIGPWKLMDGERWEYRYIPVPISYCDLCVGRIEQGERPPCEIHCLASVLEVGPIDELARKLEEKGKMASIFLP